MKVSDVFKNCDAIKAIEKARDEFLTKQQVLETKTNIFHMVFSQCSEEDGITLI